MTDDRRLDALEEEYHERAAIIEAEGAKREAANRRAWKRLVEREGAVVMRELRDRMTYRSLREKRGG